ncbi:SRPBCC family protein [Ralstonia mannitolilytica]|uniref:SRPBCC family protein n=1 Tax=Ralstonia mannitolilytica TaxID=105219 RepID=UPI0028F6370D|nr:SRPBCC family protein [Ralstonia mannitolilytica]CAJ0710786.1 hypothetical protein LMG8323_01309 [Ralstonia mannitolilytica]
MTTTVDQPAGTALRPLVISRTFPVSRDWVFQAWSTAEHIKRWFCPMHFTVPDATVEFRVGGKFDVCMRSPDGQDHWSRGHFLEIVPNARLVIDMNVVDADNRPLMNAHTVVTFAEDCGGTRMEVTQTHTPLAPIAEMMIKGASEGWKQTLDKLEREAARVPLADGVQRSVVHATFTVERTYDAPRSRVFKALTDPAAKAKWFAGGNGYTQLVREMDARPGGREVLKGRWDSGVVSSFEATYHDVIPDERVVYSYVMHLDDRKISASLATLELKPANDGAGTRLVTTEQGAFLDGYDDAGSRERGTQFLLDMLGNSLKD